MGRRAARLSVVAAVLLLLPAAPAAASHASYRYVIMAQSDPQGFGPDGCAALNDGGQVALAFVTADGDRSIIRTGPGGRTVIARGDDGFSFFGRNPSINERGSVSFAAGLDDGGEVIARGNGDRLVIIARTEPDRFGFFGFDTSLNDAGRVAVKAELDEEAGFDEGLFSGRGGLIRTHYLASTSRFQGTDTGPSINDLGEVAFQEDLDDGGRGIFLHTGERFVTIADDSGRFQSFDKPSLNNDAEVAFKAFTDEGAEAIARGDGSQLRTVADTDGRFAFFGFGGPSLNDRGWVASRPRSTRARRPSSSRPGARASAASSAPGMSSMARPWCRSPRARRR